MTEEERAELCVSRMELGPIQDIIRRRHWHEPEHYLRWTEQLVRDFAAGNQGRQTYNRERRYFWLTVLHMKETDDRS